MLKFSRSHERIEEVSKWLTANQEKNFACRPQCLRISSDARRGAMAAITDMIDTIITE